MSETPLLVARGLNLRYGRIAALDGVSVEVFAGEVLAVVGESGSGKTTLLRVLHGELLPDSGSVSFDGADTHAMGEPARKMLARTQWGFVHQNPRDGLRMAVSAGGNIGERLMAAGSRHWGNIRANAAAWLSRVEIPEDRIDDAPRKFSGGMQQRLQIARVLVTRPRLVFMDEPTGGLDVSVQARLLDLIRRLTHELSLATVIVTHDLAVARLLADRTVVMQGGRIVETGLTDQVLDDPQAPYTQLLVSSVLTA